MRIVQADSGSDSDSDSRRQSAVQADQVPTPIPTVGAKNVLCLKVRLCIVVAGAGGSVQTV